MRYKNYERLIREAGRFFVERDRSRFIASCRTHLEDHGYLTMPQVNKLNKLINGPAENGNASLTNSNDYCNCGICVSDHGYTINTNELSSTSQPGNSIITGYTLAPGARRNVAPQSEYRYVMRREGDRSVPSETAPVVTSDPDSSATQSSMWSTLNRLIGRFYV